MRIIGRGTSEQRSLLGLGLVVALTFAGCAKRIQFTALPLAYSGSGTAKVALTFDRNNTLEVVLKNVREPSALGTRLTRYVLWAATPDRQHIANIGQLRVDRNKAGIKTLTPLRKFSLFITAEESGEAMIPGPNRVFESKEIDW